MTSAAKHHVSRVLRVVHHLWQHLDEDTPLAVLAELAHFSPWHFHRLYHGVTGETVAATRQRLRLQRASLELAQRQQTPLLQVARRAGYGSSAAFVRAFRAAYGVTPGRYRRERAARLLSPINEELIMEHQPQQRTLETALDVILCPHQGSYMEIGRAFDTLNVLCHGRLGPEARWFGIYYDDPELVPAQALRSAACVSFPATAPLPDGLQRGQVPAGRYVVVTHRGPYSELHTTYRWLYRDWLPRSGLQLADAPCFEEYLNSPQSTAPKDLLTEIWTPVR